MLWRFVVVVLLAAGCFAADTLCPSTIDVHQQLAKPANGWTAMADDAPHQLAGITFFDGPPQEKASLVYDDMKKTGGRQIASWNFASGSGPQIWVACIYSGTAIQLTKALPANMKSCAVTYDSRQQVAGLPAIEKISCY